LSVGAAFAQTDPQAAPVPIQEGSTVVGEDAQAEQAGRRPDPDAEVICRVVQSVESRLARSRNRICGTRTMWEQMEDENAREARRAGAVPPPTPQ
jgi:hypothetical protein